MTFEERLEEIKDCERDSAIFSEIGESTRVGYQALVNDYDFEWMIEQLELLHKQNRTLNKKNHRLWKVNQELTADRDELRRRYESNRQTYINVQKGRADKRRKNRG